MPAAGVAAITPAQMVLLRVHQVRPFHIRVAGQQLEHFHRFCFRLARRGLLVRTHENNPGEACARSLTARGTTASARRRSAMERDRLGLITITSSASSPTTEPFRN